MNKTAISNRFSAPSMVPSLTAALAAIGLISTANAQLQVGGALLVNVDATSATLGSLTNITNMGTLGGYFEARGGGATVPLVAVVHGGTHGIQFDGGQFMQLVPTLGAAPTTPPPGIVGPNPTFTIEAWVLNPVIQDEETVVSWGKRGGPDGSNCSFNYGYDGAYGAMGHWGSPDMGWDSSNGGTVYVAGTPAPGLWHHLVYTFDGSVQRVYADGVQKNSENVSLNIASGTSINMATQLEADGVTPTAGLRGSFAVGRLRIHDEALTAAQVANNFNVEKAAFANNSLITSAPVHRYSFNNGAGPAPDGSVIVDSAGSSGNGVVRGAGASFTGSRISLPGGSSATQAYVDLPNGLLSANSTNNGGLGQVTIEGWVKVTGGRTWGRIFDFGSSDIGGGVGGEVTGAGGGGEGKDYLMWSTQVGDDLNNQQIGWRNVDPTDPGAPLNGGSVNHGTSSQITFPKDIHFALTWDERTSQVLIYENASLVSTMTMPIAMSDIHDVNVWLGRSNWSGDQNAQEELIEFRIYNRVLPPEQLDISYQSGPDALPTAGPVTITAPPANRTVAEFGSTSFSAAAQGAPPLGWQWYKGTTPIPGANTNTVTLSNIPGTDNNAQVYVVASNVVSGTTYYATSAVAVLTVNPDTNAPTITIARQVSTNLVEIVFSERVLSNNIAGTNFTLIGPAGSPTIISVSPTASGQSALLTLSGPLAQGFSSILVSNIHDISSGANVIAPGSVATIWNLLPGGATHRYTFNNPVGDASGATVPDIVGTGNGVVRNAGGTTVFTGSRVTLSGGPSATSPYIDLPNGLLSVNSTNNGGSGKLTFEGWVKITGNRQWSRIFDFGSSGPCCATGGEVPGPGQGGDQGIDYLFYSAQVDVNTARRQLSLANRDQGDHGTVFVEYGENNFNQDVHFVVTWDEASGLMVIYENGSQVALMNTVAAMSEINDVNVWLGRSNWVGDQNTQGEFDEFRVYNRVLTLPEIQLNQLSGPDANFGVPTSIDVVVTNSPFVTNSISALPVLVSFSNIGTQNVAGLAGVTYSSSNPSIAEITADGLLHAYSAGTTIVSAAFGGLQQSATVVVANDNTPPHLVSARSEGSLYIQVKYSEGVDEVTGGEPLSYTVSSGGTIYEVAAAQRLSDPSEVLLTMSAPLPCQYITVTANGVSDLAGNADANSGSASYFNYAPTALKHRYTFNNASNVNATGATILDGIGAGDGLIRGAPTSFTGNRVVLNGGSSATAGYVDLPNGILSTNSTNNAGSGQVSFEGWVKITGSKTWSRLLDFGSTGTAPNPGTEVIGPGGSGDGIDYLMLSAQVGDDTAHRRLEIQNRDQNGHGNVTSDHAVTNFNQDVHYVLTWDERTGLVRVFENGVQVNSATTVAAMSEINDVNVWLGRSTWLGDQNLQGEYDEFRVYNRILTQAEIALDDRVGPDNNFGAPRGVRVSSPTVLHLGQATQSSLLADFVNVSNVNLSVAGCAFVTSLTPSVVSNDSAGVLYPLSYGAATLRAVFNGFTNTLSVIVSNEPPVAGNDSLVTQKGTPVSVTTSNLLANDTDVDNDGPLAITGVSATSTNGGTVSLSSSIVTYTPPAGYVGSDLFTYTVTDTNGAPSVGRVYVAVIEGAVPTSNHVTISRSAGGSFTVNFRGTPGTTYRVQRATDVTGPWTTVSTQTVSPSGIISYVDNSPPAGQAFYRVVTP